jgi:hypothetical protein
MKAFLSHSSLDKEFVQEVADQLGRVSCIFDKYSFNNGVEFEESILKYLDVTSVFVFFATQNSLNSFWCDFEIKEALYQKINKNIKKSLVYIISNDLNIGEIPPWLKRALIVVESSPSIIARDINYQLKVISEQYQRPIFLGRGKERELIEDIQLMVEKNQKHLLYLACLV